MKIKTLLFFVLIIQLMFGQQNHYDGKTERLSLKEAINFALKNNPSLNRSREEMEISKSERWSAVGVSSPSISYMKEGYKPSQSSLYGEKRWSVYQSIDFPLTSYFRLKKSGKIVDAKKLEIEYAKKELSAEVKINYVEVLYFKKLIELSEKQIELATRLKRVAEIRLAEGEIAELELMNSEIQLAEAENFLESVTQDYHSARYKLFEVVGIDPTDQSYRISFADTLSTAEINFSQDDVLSGLISQPIVESKKSLAFAASEGVNEAWSSILPKIDFSYYHQDYGSGYDFRGFEIGFSVPLWFVFNENPQIQIAKAKERDANWAYKQMEISLKTKIESAWHGYESSSSKINRYKNVIRGMADELQKLTFQGYEIGEIDLLRLLDAQQTYLTTEINYYTTLKTYYQHMIQLEMFVDKELVY